MDVVLPDFLDPIVAAALYDEKYLLSFLNKSSNPIVVKRYLPNLLS